MYFFDFVCDGPVWFFNATFKLYRYRITQQLILTTS